MGKRVPFWTPQKCIKTALVWNFLLCFVGTIICKFEISVEYFLLCIWRGYIYFEVYFKIVLADILSWIMCGSGYLAHFTFFRFWVGNRNMKLFRLFSTFFPSLCKSWRFFGQTSILNSVWERLSRSILTPFRYLVQIWLRFESNSDFIKSIS